MPATVSAREFCCSIVENVASAQSRSFPFSVSTYALSSSIFCWSSSSFAFSSEMVVFNVPSSPSISVLKASSCAMTSAFAELISPDISALSEAISLRSAACASSRDLFVLPISASSAVLFSWRAEMYSFRAASVFSMSPIVLLIEVTCASIEGIFVSSSSAIRCSREFILSSSLPQETVVRAAANASNGNSLLIFIVLFT